jgi:hypothetical protein
VVLALIGLTAWLVRRSTKPARKRRTRAPAAACGDRRRHRRWTAAPCPDSP